MLFKILRDLRLYRRRIAVKLKCHRLRIRAQAVSEALASLMRRGVRRIVIEAYEGMNVRAPRLLARHFPGLAERGISGTGMTPALIALVLLQKKNV